MATTLEGQSVLVEDREGERWQVECLGDPLVEGARIEFVPLASARSRRGEFLRLVEGPRADWVCTLRRERDRLRLIPFGGVDAPELRLAEKDAKAAEDGVRVRVAPLSGRRGAGARAPRAARGSRRRNEIRVRVIEILGRPFEPDADHRALVWKHRLETRFSRRSRLELRALDETSAPLDSDSRVDLRHLDFVTIDPASARDHDDAVFAETHVESTLHGVDASGRRIASESRRWQDRLWVAIADVGHFVSAGGWIDAEARRRGNSFYFPARAIPMLPERLSTDLCSLRPGVDRRAIVVELRIGADGRIVDALFHEALVRSRARLSYEEAAEWLEPKAKGRTSSPPGWVDSLRALSRIAGRLARIRRKDGALMLELPEVEIVVGEDGRPVDARLRARNPAHGWIEEAMLAANRAVARALDRAERVAIHRVHPPPGPTSLASLAELLEHLGLEVEGDLAEPGVLAGLLDQVKGEPFEERVHLAVLRSMSQARYEARSRGHYALRFEHYVHFTSPIRRYADLEVHRALRALIRGEPLSAGEKKKAMERATRLAIWLSGRERVAVLVERDAEALACCAVMAGREGEDFDAHVTAVTEFGLFVRLEAPAASGLVPMRFLEEEWDHDQHEEILFDERSGRRIALGDRIRVRLVEVDGDRIRLAFRLSGSKGRSGLRSGRRSGRRP